jgi:hypothetical protein
MCNIWCQTHAQKITEHNDALLWKGTLWLRITHPFKNVISLPNIFLKNNKTKNSASVMYPDTSQCQSQARIKEEGERMVGELLEGCQCRADYLYKSRKVLCDVSRYITVPVPSPDKGGGWTDGWWASRRMPVPGWLPL